MPNIVHLYINDKLFSIDKSSSATFKVLECDNIEIQILEFDGETKYLAFVEDYEANLFMTEDESKLTTGKSKYFSESFGYSCIRIYAEEVILCSIVFDVSARKLTADQARKMITYLVDKTNSSSVVNACLSRSAVPFGFEKSLDTEPESIISSVEILLNIFQKYRGVIEKNARQRLIPIKSSIGSRNISNFEIDAIDILQNLDSLIPSDGLGDVTLRGRNYSIKSLDAVGLSPTNNVIENQILLGGLYYSRKKLGDLLDLLDGLPKDQDNNIVGYESFSRLLLSLTASGMFTRCRIAGEKLLDLIYFFEKKLEVKYCGEIKPIMTPFVRGSRMYKSLFEQMAEVYSIGRPCLGNIRFFMKMKSLSKIYEVFCFYHILEFFHNNEWQLLSVTRHEDEDFIDVIPASAVFKKGNLLIDVEYEKKIHPYSIQTRHFDLVDVYHTSNSDFPFFTPDFVIKLNKDNHIRYLILDAKYSTGNTVKTKHIPKIYEKYFEGVAVFDAQNNITTNAPISAVIAIFPIEHNASRYLSHWPYQGIFNKIPRIPAIGASPLTTDSDSVFYDCIERLLELSLKTIHATDQNPTSSQLKNDRGSPILSFH